MKIWSFAFVVMIILPSTAVAKSCAAMTRELEQLRLEYRTYAESPSTKSGSSTFEGLCEILDKIIELKNDMRKSCPRVNTSRRPRAVEPTVTRAKDSKRKGRKHGR